jgi:ketosteroid isomerase-like protein
LSDTAEHNIEIARRAYEAWAEGDVDAFFEEFVHPEVEWEMPPLSPEPGPFRGHDEVRKMVDGYFESFDVFRPEPERILPATRPDQVVALVTTHTRGKGSGAEVDIRVGHLLTIRNDMVIRFQVIIDQREALAAAGLDPQRLSPLE